ncbi:MAG: hypothetical protein IT448_10000 [Phycisphaerales bacterium]|nr:hypothetical protein [Phycisphaerales bacterium]
MPVSIDNTIINTEQLGLKTLGQVLEYINKQARVAVAILLDGKSPQLSDMDTLRSADTEIHTIQLETADPREMAMDALIDMQKALDQADASKNRAAELLQRNQAKAAMLPLNACLETWQQAQQCITQSAQLVGINLDSVEVGGRNLQSMANHFAGQLREIRRALEDQDYVALGDVLNYELDETGQHWRDAIISLSTAVAQAK